MRVHRVLIALALLLGLSAGLRDRFDAWVEATQLPPVLLETSVEMRDRRGALLRVFPVEDGRVRMALDLDRIDPDFLAMLIAYEDKRFYSHSGVDVLAALRAVGQAIWHQEVVSGGSTLTMQVARLLENSGTGRWQGKLRQVRLALALERRFSKQEILSLYLLHAPYGGAVEGVRAGSLAWFGKEPNRLSLAEAALLVALPQSPETRRPDRFPETALAARERVLERIGAAPGQRLLPIPQAMRPFPRLAPHLTDHMRRQDPLVQVHDLTLDRDLQAKIEALLKRAVLGQPRGVSAAMVIADHKTGEVLASAGSATYSDVDGASGFVDMTRAIRSPGSTLKPLIFGMAFDQGLAHPSTLINDAPVSFGTYSPKNFDGEFRGELSVREALQQSLNIAPVLLTNEMGAARLMAGMRRGGANPKLPGGKPGLAVALGGVGLTLNDLVQLYAGMANGGMRRDLMWRFEADVPEPRRVMSRAAAWHVGDILSGIRPPAGTTSDNGQIAYKTGTSYGHRDAWTIGYDGQHVIGIWMGRPDGTPVPGAFGAELAAPIVFEAFGRVKPQLTPLPSPPPETLLVSASQLPVPLRRFRSRDAVFTIDADAPVVNFPPNDAVLQYTDDGIPLKLQSGMLPLTVLINGRPVLTGLRQRETFIKMDGKGFSRISVIDARGRTAQVDVRLN